MRTCHRRLESWRFVFTYQSLTSASIRLHRCHRASHSIHSIHVNNTNREPHVEHSIYRYIFFAGWYSFLSHPASHGRFQSLFSIQLFEHSHSLLLILVISLPFFDGITPQSSSSHHLTSLLLYHNAKTYHEKPSSRSSACICPRSIEHHHLYHPGLPNCRLHHYHLANHCHLLSRPTLRWRRFRSPDHSCASERCRHARCQRRTVHQRRA